MGILERVIIDGSILAILVGILGYFLKISLTKFLDYKIDEKIEERKMEREVKKEMEITKLKNTVILYPQILELTYKLRNDIRDITDYCNSNAFKTDHFLKNSWEDDQLEKIILLEQHFHKMEDLVITSKAFVDVDTHNKFHEFKNIIKDKVIPTIKNEIKANYDEECKKIESFLVNLNEAREQSEFYFSKITGNVKTKLNTN